MTDALTLNPDGIVTFYKIVLSSGGTIYLTNDQQKTWNGELWEGTIVKLTGVGSYGDDQVSRPKVQILNPDGAYTKLVSEGAFELATFYRIRVSYQDYIENNPVYIQQLWSVARVTSLSKIYVNVELTDMTNIPNFIIPARTYSPPDFPVVSV